MKNSNSTRLAFSLTGLALGAAVAASSILAVPAGPAFAAGGHQEVHRHHWSFSGFFGQYDKTQLRRGFQVYKEVCAACHGLDRVKFRNLVEDGGPEFDEEAVKVLAAEWANQITDGPNEEGEMFQRPAKLSDPIKGPWKNENEARSINNGAYPLDLSLIARARTYEVGDPWYQQIIRMGGEILTGYEENGDDYIYSLLTGYSEPPEGFKLGEGLSYNKAYPGNQIAMAQPIPEGGGVEYQENAGATSSLEQNAEDVTAFLAWAADPHLNTRKQIGWQVMLYLLITTVLLYLGKRRIWARAKKELHA